MRTGTTAALEMLLNLPLLHLHVDNQFVAAALRAEWVEKLTQGTRQVTGEKPYGIF